MKIVQDFFLTLSCFLGCIFDKPITEAKHINKLSFLLLVTSMANIIMYHAN